MFTGSVKTLKECWSQPSSSMHSLAQAAHPGTDFSSWINRGKMMLRLCLFLRQHRQVKAIFHDPFFRQIVSANPGIYEKIYREYIFCGATIDERLRLLTSHYQFVREVFDHSLIKSIYLLRNHQLCTVPLSCGAEKVFARLSYLVRFEKEGELTLGLHDKSGRRLYSISFSFQSCNGKRTALIGCIIGSDMISCSEEESPLSIKSLTKGMHGIRPKNLVFFLLQAFCQHLGVHSIMAVGSDSHIYSGQAKRRDRISFDYDDFWEEVGGRVAEDDRKLFSLPLHYTRRSFEEMRSNKRAIYLRRYALLDDIDAQIQQTMNSAGHRPTREAAQFHPGPCLLPGLLIEAA